MLISWNWLKRHVDLEGLDPLEVGDLFTLKVAELEGVHAIGAGLEALRTVLIQSVEPHPNSDKLSLVTVLDGDDEQTVVCGAPNAKEGTGRVAVLAPIGSTLPNGMEIAEAEIRGVVSKGMLASEKELGLSDDHGGIILLQDGTPHGVAYTDAVPVQDWVFEVDNKAITHRPDLWGHMGIAREVATLTGRAVTTTLPDVNFGNDDRISVTVSDPELCARYLCTYFTGVTIGPSPEWLQCLLRATGVRPISNVVDLTNFVMMDVGNPLHAFDARFVQDGQITVRRANEGEKATTLDGQEHPCTDETLLICDSKGALAVAGIMGGADSEIRDDTQEVILEAANFQARNIRRTATRLGLRTESSARFEKSLDPASAETAARLFTALMVELIDGCQVVSPLVDVAAPPQRTPVIHLDPDSVTERLGVDIPVSRTREILMGLGFEVQDSSNGTLKVHVPSWRATKDVAIAEDLIEEIGRMHGYENIPPQAAHVQIKPPHLSPAKQQERAVRAYLSDGCGLHEQISYSFVWRPILEKIGADIGGRLELANTISSDLDRMRRSIVPNLLHATEKNQRFFQEFGLYEVGRVFHPVEGELPCQDRTAALVIVGKDTQNRSELEEAFRSVKGVVEGLIDRMGAAQPTQHRPEADPNALYASWLHPARSVLLSVDGNEVGYVGALHPRAKQGLGLSGAIHIAEINLDALLPVDGQGHGYEPLPKYPGISFDVSFEVNQEVTAGAIAQAIRDGANTELLCDCTLFANYHLDSGRKSVSFHLLFRSSEGSLTDAEVNGHIDAMVKHVTTSLGAELRGG